MTYMALCDTSTCDKFNGSTAKWFKIDQIGKKSDGNTWYQQDVGAYRSPLSLYPSVSLFALSPGCVINPTHSEPQTHLCDASDESISRRLPSPERDHRAPTGRVARRSRVLSLMHANPHRRLPIGHPQPNRPLPGRIQRHRPGHLRSGRIHTRVTLHLSRSARVESRVARGHDWRGAVERLVLGARVLVAVIHQLQEECPAHVYEWFRCADPVESGLQTAEAKCVALAA